MKFSREQIREHYRHEAEKHGAEGTSTIQDMRTRLLELAALAPYLRDGFRVLEIGCGNGFMSYEAAKLYDIDIDAFDASEEMVALAKGRDIRSIRGRLGFFVGDVLTFDRRAVYDLAFSVRCLQNLLSWDEQQKALANVARSLKPGGEYLMEECFLTGLNNLNAARAELDLPAIPEAWHNVFFDEANTIAFMETQHCRVIEQNCFLSGYYFGSRVLLPALLPAGKKATSASILNDYFAALPPAGDFAPMKIIRFRKEA
ncbi:MAG: class I SAM-dependent methyltransferase [Rhodospirillales bacterium]|nr:class I SAM-dependent methyltransferase [Rhodospirillales bacterium]